MEVTLKANSLALEAHQLFHQKKIKESIITGNPPEDVTKKVQEGPEREESNHTFPVKISGVIWGER